jgi:hypothetical protein
VLSDIDGASQKRDNVRCVSTILRPPPRFRLKQFASKTVLHCASESRNKKHVKADWQFTTADVRLKLKRLHPVL